MRSRNRAFGPGIYCINPSSTTDTKQPPKQQKSLTCTPFFQSQEKPFKKKIFIANCWDKHGREKKGNNEKL